MKKFFKWFGIGFLVIILIGIVGFQVMKSLTKKHSPEETVSYKENGYDIEVVYCRPFKKEREIFGGLVPYGKVWRTGANEATTFTTGTDLIIDEQTLPAGQYTLWTIPGPKMWEVIFNNGQYGWGVDLRQEASRNPELDVVNVTVPVQRNFKVLEQFTIEIDHDPALLMLGWDHTRVDVAMQLREDPS
jgi:hypothetical protein